MTTTEEQFCAELLNTHLRTCRLLAEYAVDSIETASVEALESLLCAAVLGGVQIQILATISDAPVVQVLAVDMAGEKRELLRLITQSPAPN